MICCAVEFQLATSRSVEQKNGVIDDTFDQDLEMALGSLEGELGLHDLSVRLVVRGL